jgi:molybdate transport system substrate-binding protein
VRDKVETVTIPADPNTIATYPIAQLKEANDPELARKWLDLATSEKGQKVLERWGFEPAS